MDVVSGLISSQLRQVGITLTSWSPFFHVFILFKLDIMSYLVRFSASRMILFTFDR